MHWIGLFDAVWDTFLPGMKALLASMDAQHVQLHFSFLKAFRTEFAEDTHPLSVAESLFQWVVEDVLDQSRSALGSLSQDEGTKRTLSVLLGMIDAFGDSLFVDFGHAEVGMLVFSGFSLYLHPHFMRCWTGRFRNMLARY